MTRECPSELRLVFGKVLLALLFGLLGACEPRDVQPGLWLSGEEVSGTVDDWRFTDQLEEIFIEARPWYGLPHSTTIWCVAFQGSLFIGSYGEEKKRWEVNLQADPQARLKINDRLYDVVVTQVTDQSLTAELDQAYNAKYDMAEVFGNEIPAWWFYRVEQFSP